MEIKEGMYIRTKEGSIAKVLGFDIFEEGNGTGINNLEAVYFDDIVNDISKDIYRGCFNDVFKDAKASYNLIDLIEVRDYVNDVVIHGIDEYGRPYHDAYDMEDTMTIYSNQDIKTIVTKEQFEGMQYKVEK